MNVCRLRDTPIISFVNKMDRISVTPLTWSMRLKTCCDQGAPINWPIGMGVDFKGVYNLYTDSIHLYTPGQGRVSLPE